MAKPLTPLELRTIDEYLEEAGVRYDDIRHEMTDHVATAIENMDGTFKDNFSRYMLYNKKDLLASNRAFKKLARNKALGILKSTVLKPQLWAVALTLFALAILSGNYSDVEDRATDLEITLLIVSSVLYVYFWFYKIISRNNYSVINRLVTFIYCGSIVFRAGRLIDNTMVLLFYYSFSITFFLFLMQSLWALNKQYKLRYNA
ncbi:hypothetical protein Q765_20450 [Flavobacterium rivuli WB 3.3-2 = DSM 21788]|uniref:Uncharacterized protein n=1 Tax=Flavobacterium rivuli WB 3.3-2 = DSM 21788 TaxID=1121895 RepID=A0A0A2LZL7_9FLAO|nr:hypothetical protein [Flavobacterium rivuli]KGO84633.1 hypothetical protein Q765_20450 [Flavobacterium rivuli WB 3.3-2 = DSM 21788]